MTPIRSLCLSLLLCSCAATATHDGLAPAIQVSRDTWCEPDHDLRLFIDSTEYRFDDSEDMRRISVPAGLHVLTHYVGGMQMQRWTVEVQGRTYVKLPCWNQRRRRPAYPVPKQ